MNTRSKLKVRLRMKLRRPLLKASAVSMLIICSMIFYFQFVKIENVHSVANGDYRSKVTGNWNVAGTWEIYSSGSWIAASATPTSADGSIEIQSGHTVTVSANVTADQVIVDAGGLLVVSGGKTLTIANGASDDLTVYGILTANGTLAGAASSSIQAYGTITVSSGGAQTAAAGCTITINNGGLFKVSDTSIPTAAGIWTVTMGGTFQYDVDGGNLPLATWNSGSTCSITGITGVPPGNLTQSFHNFTWNCPGMTATEKLSGLLTTINGDFTMISSGSGRLRFSQQESYTLNIGGNFYMQGGLLYCSCKGDPITINVAGDYFQSGGTYGLTDGTTEGGTSPTVMTVSNFNISGGTFDMTSNVSNGVGDGVTTLNISSDYTQTGGTFTETATTGATYGYGKMYFTKSGTQTFTKTGGTMSNTVNYIVNSTSTLDVGTSVFTGSGTFTLTSGGGMIIANTSGITATAASGSVQVTGTRSYSTGGNFTYNATSAQVTGDGLPSLENNLTINNSSGVTLTNSTNTANILTMTLGDVTTNANILTLGTATSSLGTLSRASGNIVGYFKRWIAAAATSNILFPLGASNGTYQGLNYSFTIAPTTGGTITANLTIADPGKNGFNLYDSPDSLVRVAAQYWTCTPANGFAGGTFSLDMTATNLPNVNTFSVLRIIRRNDASSAWVMNGTNVTTTGSSSVPVLHRTGMTSHGQFGIGSTSANPLPISLLYFKAKAENGVALLTWATATEVNNDYFTIERSQDGINYKELSKQQGAGNSTSTLYYSSEDDSPLNGTIYYRLKQTDFDGKFSYSPIRTVTFKSSNKENKIEIESVGPNPFSNNLNMKYNTTSDGAVQLQILSNSGQMVFNDIVVANKGSNSYSFDGASIPAGIYFVSFELNGKRVTKKVIKQ